MHLYSWDIPSTGLTPSSMSSLNFNIVLCLDHAPCKTESTAMQPYKLPKTCNDIMPRSCTMRCQHVRIANAQDYALSRSRPEPLRGGTSDHTSSKRWVMHQRVSPPFPLETKSTFHTRTPSRSDFAGSLLPTPGFTRLLTPVPAIPLTPCLAAAMFRFAISSRAHLTDAIVRVD